MKLPQIDLSSLIKLLRADGYTELCTLVGTKLGGLKILLEWDNILLVMEKEIIPLLNKGCDAKDLIAPAQKIGKSATALAGMAAEVLSFVPGPIGIVCSLALAIGCFSTGNIIGGLCELLGCIPGGKCVGKSTSKLFPKVEKIMIEMAQSNLALKKIVESSVKQQKIVTDFFQKHAPKPKAKPKADVGYEYGVRSELPGVKTGNMPSLEEAMQINMSRQSRTHIPAANYYYPESTNSMIYRLGTNTGKSLLW